MQAGYLPITDEWAANSVISSIRSQVKSGIDQQYPNLPDANKNSLIDVQMQKTISQNKAQIDQQVAATSQYFKDFFQDSDGKNYMPDIDPYYWFRYVKNIVNHGYPGDEIRNGVEYDNHQVAPVGRPVPADRFHTYFLAYFYKALHIFVPGLTIMRSMFYYPVFVSAISVLLVFLIARDIGGNSAGFFAATIMAVNSAFLGRTLFGHADSDAWVVFFPLIITWLFLSTEESKTTLKTIIFASVTGLFTAIYIKAWGGWWYIFYFLLIAIFATFAYQFFAKFDNIKKNFKLIWTDNSFRSLLIIGVVYILSTALFAMAFSSWTGFTAGLKGPLSFQTIKSPVTKYLWPNVLTTVAELNEGSMNSIINSIGGPFFFFVSLIGLVLSIQKKDGMKRFDYFYLAFSAIYYAMLFIKIGSGPAFYDSLPITMLIIVILIPLAILMMISIYKKDASYDFKLSLLLALWMASAIFASLKGIRFTLLLAPPFSVSFGIALAKTYSLLSQWATKGLKIHKTIASTIIILSLLFVFYADQINGAVKVAGTDLPLINDAWYNSLIKIKENSTETAIITSWWDFGHHFKAIADRPVTFDGTTQTDQAAHWVGRIFMTDNEAEAVGILRMIDCSHNKAFNTLMELTNKDTHKSLKIVKETILLDKEKARKKLKEYGLSSEETDKILSYTHCSNPPEGYLIASEDMIGKSGVWSHFGSWNFERADIWYNARSLPQEDAVKFMMGTFNYTKEKAENTYYEVQAITSDSEANSWVAPWPGYGGTISCSRKAEGYFLCDNGLMVNMSTYDVFATSKDGITRPKSVAFVTEKGMTKKTNNGATIDIGITIIPRSDNELEGVLSSKELTGSMFTRMFYTSGHGLKYFKLIDHQHGLTGTDIYTYKVDWEGKETTIVSDFAPQPKTDDKKETNQAVQDASQSNS